MSMTDEEMEAAFQALEPDERIKMLADVLQTMEKDYPGEMSEEAKTTLSKLQAMQKNPRKIVKMPPLDELRAPSAEEKESFHWMLAIGTVLCAVIGFCVLGLGATGDLEVVGYVTIALSVLATAITNFWTKVDRLPLIPKIIAWAPAVIGGGVIFILLSMVGAVGKEAGREIRRAEFRHDVGEVVRRGRRK